MRSRPAPVLLGVSCAEVLDYEHQGSTHIHYSYVAYGCRSHPRFVVISMVKARELCAAGRLSLPVRVRVIDDPLQHDPMISGPQDSLAQVEESSQSVLCITLYSWVSMAPFKLQEKGR